ncbi:hypothetical protein LEL_09166 [Akanthomyces lecanii RCEF 1005]|uniref:Alpha-L-rhamnosidase C n=1 Tax=Akanthomyces lecanii RCEF 1005 TaxID=1081108 RepID=A0A168CY09_CORDF|nr:hypothetical protein LEL_09166 [Akanthomyces lecanii RCEF 1005]
MATPNNTEPFPAVGDETSEATRSPSHEDGRSTAATRPTASSSISSRIRRLSVTFEESGPPEGFMAATGGIASSMITGRPARGSISSSIERRDSANQAQDASPGPIRTNTIHSVAEEQEPQHMSFKPSAAKLNEPSATAAFPNGYHFPPKHSFWQSTKDASITFWNYFITPVGFLVTLYGLNVVAWGGMLFLLLCNASPAMCRPNCNDINSPRRIWIEIDSQVLNALFCVTGFGLAPWRFRDLYFLLKYRLGGQEVGLRRLAGIHRGWFRLQGSSDLEPSIGPDNVANRPNKGDSDSVPYPEDKIPDAPLTGVRARATALWKLDFVIWFMVGNTLLQCVLCGFMWGMNRYDRPSWSTGLFVALGCIVAIIAGLVMFFEGKAVKGVEGVPISQADMDLLARDRERGIYHYNNMGDKDEEKSRKEKKKGTKTRHGDEERLKEAGVVVNNT